MAASSARKAAPKDKTAAEAEVPKRRRLHIPSLATLSADMRTLLLNLCLLVIILVMIPVVGLQFLRAPVIIDTIAVPPVLTARGLSADVVANRLWDGLTELEAQAGSSKEGVTAIPKNQRVDFSIPDSGISIDSLVFYVRQFFHLYQTRISGEFVCADAECGPEGMSLRLRILRDKLEILQMPPIGQQGEAVYFRAAAARILGVLDPFLAAAVEVQSNPAAGLARAERLVRTGDPAAIWALNLIGNTQRDLGQTDAAIAAFRAALKIDPGFVIAQTNLGTALVEQGDLAGAAQVFDAVARAHPQDRFLALGRYRLAMAKGDAKEAIAQVLKADAADPGKAMYLGMAGQAAYGANDIPAAEGYFQRALAVAPDDDMSVTLLSLMYQMAGDYAKAGEVLGHALAIAPDNPGFLYANAGNLARLQKPDAALAELDRLLALTPDDAQAQKLRGVTLQGLGRDREALAQFETAMRLLPKDVEILERQGLSLQALGQNAAAAKAYRAAIALDPADPFAMMAQAFLDKLPPGPQP